MSARNVSEAPRALITALTILERRNRGYRRTIAVAWQLARLDLLRRYTTTMLGLAWAVVAPLLMSIVIGFVFARLFGVPVREFLPYLFLNLTVWAFFSACLDGGASAFVASEGYIKQIPGVSFFTYPLRMLLAAFVTFILGLLAVCVVTVAMGGPVGLGWLWVVPALLVWIGFGFGMACLSGVLNTALRDFQYLQGVGLQALFYATPVMFPADLLADRGLSWLLAYNPLYHLMTIVRIPLLYNQPAPLPHYVASLMTLCVALLAGYFAIRYSRRRLVFWL